MDHSDHYSEDYFRWQQRIGEFGGWANIDKFSAFIQEDYSIIDFGSGGGFLLNQIKCREKIGIEINEPAIRVAEKSGIHTVNSLDQIRDEWADLIISNHALEHTLNPLSILSGLHTKLKPGGKIIFVVPCESIRYRYKEEDINHHLFSWSPMSLGNLFSEAGFRIIESKALIHKWPPFHYTIARIFGRRIFNLICRIYGRISRRWFQVRVIAEK